MNNAIGSVDLYFVYMHFPYAVLESGHVELGSVRLRICARTMTLFLGFFFFEFLFSGKGSKAERRMRDLRCIERVVKCGI